MTKTFIPLTSHTPVPVVRNLLTAPMPIGARDTIETLIEKAETAFPNGNTLKALQVDQTYVDLQQCWERRGHRPGVQILNEIARAIPPVWNNEHITYEIAGLLATDDFWKFDVSAVEQALPPGSPYQLRQPTRTAVNVSVSGDKLLIHKHTQWHEFAHNGEWSQITNGQPALETDVIVAVSLRRCDPWWNRVTGKTEERSLAVSIQSCNVGSPDDGLLDHLFLREESLWDSICRAIQRLFSAGYFVETCPTKIWKNEIMPSRPTVPAWPLSDGASLRNVKPSAFDAEARVIGRIAKPQVNGEVWLHTDDGKTVRRNSSHGIPGVTRRTVRKELKLYNEAGADIVALQEENARLSDSLAALQVRWDNLNAPPPPPPVAEDENPLNAVQQPDGRAPDRLPPAPDIPDPAGH